MAPTPKTKALKKDTDPKPFMTVLEIQNQEAESWHHSLDSAFFVLCSEESQDEVAHMADTDAAECMQSIKNIAYYNTGFVLNNCPVWKSAECAQVIGSPLYWFVCEEMNTQRKWATTSPGTAPLTCLRLQISRKHLRKMLASLFVWWLGLVVTTRCQRMCIYLAGEQKLQRALMSCRFGTSTSTAWLCSSSRMLNSSMLAPSSRNTPTRSKT